MGADGAGALRDHADGLLLTVKVAPGAKQTLVAGCAEDAAGQSRLKVRVSAAPEKGKANGAVLKLLAKTLGVPQSRLHLIGGGTGRIKSLLIEGDSAALRRQLAGRLPAACKG